MAFGQALLREPAVESHAEPGQVVLDIVPDAVQRLLPDVVEAFVTKQFVGACNKRADVLFLVAVGSVGRNALEN